MIFSYLVHVSKFRYDSEIRYNIIINIIEIFRHCFKHIGDSIMPLTTPGIDTKVKK